MEPAGKPSGPRASQRKPTSHSLECMPTAVFKSVLEVEEAYGQTVPVVVTPATAGFQMRADEQELGDGISIADIRTVPLRARTRSRVVRPFANCGTESAIPIWPSSKLTGGDDARAFHTRRRQGEPFHGARGP